MPIETQRIGERIGRAMQGALVHTLVAFPWTLLFWLGSVIALRRWSGLPLVASLGVSAASAMQGWRSAWGIGNKLDDAHIARLIHECGIEDAPAWTIFPQQEQVIKAAHLSRCVRRWGVNARSSGWERLCMSWRKDAVSALACIILAVHAWWIGM